MAPESHHKVYFPRLKRLVEDTYKNNGNRRVVLMGHGMGGLMINTFLVNMTDHWKFQYVHVFVPVAVPWAGSVKALYDYKTGGFFKTPFKTAKYLYYDIYRTWETAKLLLPRGLAWKRKGLIGPFLNDDEINTYWLRFKKIVQPRHPGVDILSLLSTDVATIDYIDLHDNPFTSSKHYVRYGEGDGSVNKCSLYDNHHFDHKKNFNHRRYLLKYGNHLQVLSSESMIDIMKNINS